MLEQHTPEKAKMDIFLGYQRFLRIRTHELRQKIRCALRLKKCYVPRQISGVGLRHSQKSKQMTLMLIRAKVQFWLAVIDSQSVIDAIGIEKGIRPILEQENFTFI